MTEEQKDGCAVGLTKAALILSAGFFRVYVMTVLWSWFLVPFGLPALPFWHTCGILSIVGLIKVKAFDEEENRKLMTWQHVTMCSSLGTLPKARPLSWSVEVELLRACVRTHRMGWRLPAVQGAHMLPEGALEYALASPEERQGMTVSQSARELVAAMEKGNR